MELIYLCFKLILAGDKSMQKNVIEATSRLKKIRNKNNGKLNVKIVPNIDKELTLEDILEFRERLRQMDDGIGKSYEWLHNIANEVEEKEAQIKSYSQKISQIEEKCAEVFNHRLFYMEMRNNEKMYHDLSFSKEKIQNKLSKLRVKYPKFILKIFFAKKNNKIRKN